MNESLYSLVKVGIICEAKFLEGKIAIRRDSCQSR